MIFNGIPDDVMRCIDYEDSRTKRRAQELLEFSPEEREKFDLISNLEEELQIIYKKSSKSAWLIGVGTVATAAVINPILAVPAIYAGFVAGTFGASRISANRSNEIQSKIDEIISTMRPSYTPIAAREALKKYQMLKYGS